MTFYILGQAVGTGSGSGTSFSASVNIGALGLTANAVCRAVASDANGNRLSFATMMIPVFVPPAWVAAVFGPITGSATYYSKFYSYSFSLGSGDQDPPVEDDKLPISVSV